MLNKKFILKFVCLLTSLFIYAESGTIGFLDQKRPHHDFSFQNNGNTSRYRIQMNVPHYAYFVDSKVGDYVERFPNFEMGIVRESGTYDPRYYEKRYSLLSIFPEIILKSESLRDYFAIKGTARKEGGFLYNCCVTDWAIFEKGLELNIIYEKKLEKVYLLLKEDGKYYEADNAENFGNLKKKYSDSDFFYEYWDNLYLSYFSFFGYQIYKMKTSKEIENVLADNILFYNKTDKGIEFITPYGCGFFDFKTESISLVPKEKYLGKEFTYTPYSRDFDWKFKEKRKTITEEDLNPPDIKILLEDKDIRK